MLAVLIHVIIIKFSMTICHWLWLLFFLWYKKKKSGRFEGLCLQKKMQWTPKWNWWRDQSKLCFPSYSWNPLTSIVSWLCQNYSIYLPFHFVKCLSISLLSKTLLGTFLLKSSFPITCSLSLLPCPRFKVTFLACLSSFRGPPHTAETVGAYKLQWQRRLPSQVTEKQDKLVWTRIIWSFQGHPTWPYLAPPNMPNMHIWARQI